MFQFMSTGDKEKGIYMIEQLNVPFFENLSMVSPLERISYFLDMEEKKPLAFSPWKTYAFTPLVNYAIAHGSEALFLKFYVEEQLVIAAHGTTNAPVYKDSCVEFFISFDENGYYNFEFNCLGACLAEFGSGRDDRGRLSEESIEKIRSQSVIIRDQKKGDIHWTITLAIPLNVFQFHSLSSLRGVQCRANFFKCGDELPEPHYLSWSDINAAEPDFHLPQFFGVVTFK